MMKTLILGLGNTILTDDGAGIYVVREIKKLLSSVIPAKAGIQGMSGDSRFRGNNSSEVVIQEASMGGFNFVDLLAGFDRAVIIDAIHTKNGKPGDFYELEKSSLKPSARLSSLHQIDFATACDLAEKMKVPFPKEIFIFVMEVEDEFSFGEKTTPKVEDAIPVMAGEIVKIIKDRKIT